MKLYAILMAGAVFIASADPAPAQSIVYTNGPIDGTHDGYRFQYGFAITNSFALSAPATITGFTFGGWTIPGYTILTTNYGFSTSPDQAITGSAALIPGPVIPGTGYRGQYDVRPYSATIAPVTLTTGTYYFGLRDALATNGTTVLWDVNSGPSTAIQLFIPTGRSEQVPSESFTLTGAFAAVVAPVPEPATWVSMLIGFGLIGAALRTTRRRRKLASHGVCLEGTGMSGRREAGTLSGPGSKLPV